MKSRDTIWNDAPAGQLVEVLTAIDDKTTMQNFLRDVMTENEITEISARLEAAKMLQTGKKYTDIISRTKLSSTTVARISQWLKSGCGGYQAAFGIINVNHQAHITPASAE